MSPFPFLCLAALLCTSSCARSHGGAQGLDVSTGCVDLGGSELDPNLELVPVLGCNLETVWLVHVQYGIFYPPAI